MPSWLDCTSNRQMLYGGPRPEGRPAHVVGGHPVDRFLETVPEALEAARPDVFLLVGHRLLTLAAGPGFPAHSNIRTPGGPGLDADALIK